MKFLHFGSNNNEENNSKINGIIKMLKNLKKAKIISIIAIGFAFVLFIAVFIYVVLKVFASLATLNSVERAGAERFKGETDYEKKVIERDEFLNFTQYFDTKDEKLKENNDKYFDALYDAYEFYKEEENGMTIWEKIGSFFRKLFRSKRSQKAPLYPDKSDTKMYGVEIDTTLITATLYNSRYQSEMTRNDEFDKEYSYFVEDGKGYDLHTGSYRDFVENNFLYDSKQSLDSKYHLSQTKKAIEGIEVLSKYQIKRIETYLTIHPEFVGTYTDTTRHIEINIVDAQMEGECIARVGNYGSVLGPNDYYNRVIQEAGYFWNCDPKKDSICKMCMDTYDLNIYDDDLYCFDNELTEDASGKYGCSETAAIKYSKGDIGMDAELQYELDCEGYNEYLLGNLPTDKDVEMFCGKDEESGKDNCYCDRFIESYYHQYVDKNDVKQKRRDISQIVFETYSLYSYYENATMIYNVCSDKDVDIISYRDLSCEGKRKSKYKNNIYDVTIDYDTNPEVDEDRIKELIQGALTDSKFNAEIAQKIIAAAMSKLGYPYIWGKSFDGKSGGDCSGLVYYVLNQAGINIDRTSANGYYNHFKNNQVPRSEMQPGDLIFWHKNGGRPDRYVHHVGIYIGDGKIIDASSNAGKIVERKIFEGQTYQVVGVSRPY
ncbi:nlpC/P60 family protein [Clostridium sp. CAG:762]|nr:nlpC/P60 family protein [Clostridium sp. CAG:762]